MWQFYLLRGFYKYMVVEVTNPANNPMHYGDTPPIGVISAPDQLPNRVLYTNVEANRIYNDLQYDIYQTQKEHDRLIKKPKRKKVLIGLAVAALVVSAVVFRKNIMSFGKNVIDKVKNLFKKH